MSHTTDWTCRSCRSVLGHALLEGKVLPLDVAQLLQTLPEGFKAGRGNGETLRAEIADAVDLRGLLPLPRQTRRLAAGQQAQSGQG